MLRIDNLGKRYGDHLVFRGLTHRFGPGCVVLCDEENTGKSTLLAIIAGILAPDEGDVWVDGHSVLRQPERAKARLAYVPPDCEAAAGHTGRGILEQVAAQKNTTIDDDVLELADALGLTPHLDKPFSHLSTGTRRKVFLTAAALGDPAVIIADGPSDGLDASARAVLADVFAYWGEEKVVLFASHDALLVEGCGARGLQL